MSKDVSRFSSVSPSRVAAVTGGLALLGAVAGAVVATTILIGLGLVFRSGFPTLRALAGSAGVGAACGAVFGPVVSWTLLREVPIGVAVLQTSIGAAIGAAAAIAVPVGGLAGLLGLAAIGAVAAAIRLRLAVRRKAKAGGAQS